MPYGEPLPLSSHKQRSPVAHEPQLIRGQARVMDCRAGRVLCVQSRLVAVD